MSTGIEYEYVCGHCLAWTPTAKASCSYCHGTGYVPTSDGKRILAMLAHFNAVAVMQEAKPFDPKTIEKPGIYDIHFTNTAICSAAVGGDGSGRRWFAPASWTSNIPCYDWSSVHHVVLIRDAYESNK